MCSKNSCLSLLVHAHSCGQSPNTEVGSVCRTICHSTTMLRIGTCRLGVLTFESLLRTSCFVCKTFSDVKSLTVCDCISLSCVRHADILTNGNIYISANFARHCAAAGSADYVLKAEPAAVVTSEPMPYTNTKASITLRMPVARVT